jgi:Domain of Unknown Function (DUF928)
MMLKKSYLRLTTLGFALLLEPMMMAIMPATASQLPLLTQPKLIHGELLALQRRRLGFKIPGLKPSGNLTGGAARGSSCNTEGLGKVDVVALMPQTKIGLTVAQKPTFLFRVSKTSIQEAKFKLLNAKGDTIIYDKNFPLTNTGDVTSFTLPDDAPALEIGKEYQWELVVNCDPDDPAGNPRVKTAIKRVEPSSILVDKLAQAQPNERADLYAQEGIWLDALSTLAKLRIANPNDAELQEEWTSLLESVGLKHIATIPVIGNIP